MDARAPHYQETREKVKKLLEGDQLSKRLQEFYAKQAAFHASMSRLVQVYRGVIETLPTREERQVLEDILAPYQVFLNNPLRTEPTGDNEADIAHIENVMNVRNEHFKSTLEALALTVSRNADFHQILDRLKQDKALATVMLATVKTNNWLEMKSMLDLPFQNLMRYELLLKAIGQVLEEVNHHSKAPLLSKIMDVLAYFLPELAYINEHHDTLVKLNKIEDLVMRLGKIKSLPIYATEQDKKYKISLADKIVVARHTIANARDDIARGNAHILTALTGVCEQLKELAQGLEVSLQKDTSSYTALAYYGLSAVADTLFGKNSVMPSPDKDPRTELFEVIQDLEERCNVIDAVEETERRLLAKSAKY